MLIFDQLNNAFMTLVYILLILIILLLVVLIFNSFNSSKNNDNEGVNNEIRRIESSVKDEISTNRKELNQSSKDSREELSKSLQSFGELFASNLRDLNTTVEGKLGKLTESFELKLKDFQDTHDTNSKDSRKELKDVLDTVRKDLGESLQNFSDRQRQSITDLINNQNAQNEQSKVSLEQMRGTMEKSIKSLQDDNAAKLEKMRETVDEKLQKTLNERLGQSFETVGKQLQAVQEGLGEMKNLAQDVGGLKKVLSNVKMRGGIGETQLAMLLEQILAPDQYEANVKTKTSSNDLVEFAIKLPGRDDNNMQVWLPIDAKFPKDIYEQLQTAHDIGDLAGIETAQKNLENTIKKMAKDIGEKYLDPPNTTDFGIMFLPFEGIYAEVVRKASLLDDLHRNYKVVVTGPATLAAILNSLYMGFRTLAIQKRSSEVWKVLGAVKKEFENFGGMMQKAQKNIQSGLDTLDDVMGKRTKAIQRKLRDVESLNESEARLILPEILDPEIPDDEN